MKLKATGLVALAVGAALPLAACGGGSTGGSTQTTGAANAAGTKGGTLYYLTNRAAEHLDPQRVYIGRDITDLGRLVYRSLVQYPVSTDTATANKPVPDLATNTGTMTDGGKTWSFTLKDGVKWQDGKEITCADLRYGVSRTFAQDVITGGPNYILNYMPNLAKEYKGPYTKTGQADFDKAVTCSSDNKTITYHFEKPWVDFNLAIASLRAFDPYRQDQDKGDKSNFAIFSDGPYMLQGTWTENQGGTFVRNPQYDASTDGVRKALPNKIIFQEGVNNEVISQRLIADSGNDKVAVTDRVIPPAYYSQITGAVASRATTEASPFTNYLLPNFNTVKNVKVRQALAMSMDKAAYSAALGGDKSSIPAKSIVNPAVPGYQPNPAFTAPDSGDPAGAKKLLQEAGVTLPYPIRFTYNSGTAAADNGAAALQSGWQKAGFKVTLVPLTDNYYSVIQDRNYKGGDIIWGGWGADWPSMSTVLPPLFDSRINFNGKTNGQDYGNFSSDEANSLIDKAAQQTSQAGQIAVYQDLDKYLGEQVAYMPLDTTTFYRLHGSSVSPYIQTAASNQYPDLGGIGIAGGGS